MTRRALCIVLVVLAVPACEDARYHSGADDLGVDPEVQDTGTDLADRPDGEDPGPVDLGLDGGSADAGEADDTGGVTFGCLPGACPGGSICGADDSCVIPIRSCPFVVGPDGGQRIGVLLPIAGDLGGVGRSMFLGAELAAVEFNAHVGPLQIVVCNTGTSTQTAQQLYTYLHDELGVNAIVGPALSTQVTALANGAVRNDTLLLSPSATAPHLSDLNDRDLVWTLSPPETHSAKAAAIWAVAHPGRGEGNLPGPLLIVVDRRNPVLEAMSDAVTSVLGPGPGVTVVEVDGDWHEALAAQPPDGAGVVLVMGSSAPEVLAHVEDRYPHPERNWVLVPGFFDEGLLAREARSRRVQDRVEFVGVDVGAHGPAGAAFRRSYEAANGDEDVVFAAHTYDAVWALGYAGLTPGGRARTGTAYATGLSGVLRQGGLSVVVGPEGVLDPPEPAVPWALRGASSALLMDRSGTCLSGVRRWSLEGGAGDIRGTFNGLTERWE